MVHRNATEPVERLCFSCGAPARWVITADTYAREPGDIESGRLMLYCDSCRIAKIDRILTCLPLSVMEPDLARRVLWLYEIGATQTDPSFVREEMFPDVSTAWLDEANRHMSRHPNEQGGN